MQLDELNRPPLFRSVLWERTAMLSWVPDQGMTVSFTCHPLRCSLGSFVTKSLWRSQVKWVRWYFLSILTVLLQTKADQSRSEIQLPLRNRQSFNWWGMWSLVYASLFYEWVNWWVHWKLKPSIKVHREGFSLDCELEKVLMDLQWGMLLSWELLQGATGSGMAMFTSTHWSRQAEETALW